MAGEQEIYMRYAFPNVHVKGNHLFVDEPWILMDPEKVLSSEDPICPPDFGGRLDEWYIAMQNGDSDFEISLSEGGYLRFGAGAAVSRKHADKRISIDGLKRSEHPKVLRPGCLDIRAGGLDWQGQPLEQTPPNLTETLCKEVAEEQIIWTFDPNDPTKSLLHYTQFAGLPFSKHNQFAGETQKKMFGKFLNPSESPETHRTLEKATFLLGEKVAEHRKKPLALHQIPPRNPIIINFLHEQPFVANLVDERDTSSLEVFAQFRYTSDGLLEETYMADCEERNGELLNRDILQIFPESGEYSLWQEGKKTRGIESFSDYATARLGLNKEVGNEKFSSVYLDTLCETLPGLASCNPYTPEGAAKAKKMYGDSRPDIVAALDTLAARRSELSGAQ